MDGLILTLFLIAGLCRRFVSGFFRLRNGLVVSVYGCTSLRRTNRSTDRRLRLLTQGYAS